MRIDTRPKYRLKESIVAKGFENLTIPYKGKILEKKFDKGVVVIGSETNMLGQNVIIVQDNNTTNTIDKDTKQPYTGNVYFALDPSKLEIFDAKTEAKKQIEEAIAKDGANAPIKLEKTGDVLTAEDKFYEKLGIKYNNTHMFGVASRRKGRFLVAVILVAGYFAYKKFKK